MTELDRVVLVVPIVPAPSGNGLAMRAGALLAMLSEQASVDVVVIPVSGRGPDLAWAGRTARSVQLLQPVTDTQARDHVIMQLADPWIREHLERAAPLPVRAAAAPPTLAAEIVGLRPNHEIAVLGMRAYLAPLAAAIARQLGASRLVIDLDEDDAALLRALGHADEADAFDRLARTWLPDADTVLLASPVEARAIGDRYELPDVRVVPNTVRPPPVVPPPAGPARLLLLANFTYEPNLDAASVLIEEVLPAVRARRPEVEVDLVGPALLGTLQPFSTVPGVRVTGPVPDVAPFYERAAVVVVPLRHGGGTRIKVLEAFAFGRPVVATPAALAGLDIHDGEDVVSAATPAAVADAVIGLLDDPQRAAAIAVRARRTLAERYTPGVVGPDLRSIVLGSPPR